MAQVGKWTVEYWVEPDALDQIETATYWNDRDVERGKPWDISSGDFDALEQSLEHKGLVDELKAAQELLASRGRPLAGVGADLACGIAWAVPHLLAVPEVEMVYAVEMSRHRLLELAPLLLEHVNVAEDRVVLCLGDIRHLRLADASLDFVLLSQSFHHMSDPHDLLRELRRVIKPAGSVIIIGEEPVVIPTHVLLFKYWARFFLSALPKRFQLRLFGRTIKVHKPPWQRRTLTPHDPEKGDQFYRLSDYPRMFRRHGFQSLPIAKPSKVPTGFVLLRAS